MERMLRRGKESDVRRRKRKRRRRRGVTTIGYENEGEGVSDERERGMTKTCGGVNAGME